MTLRDCAILIVDSEVSLFATELAAAVEYAGAGTVIVRDPYTGSGPDRIKDFAFTAALVSAEHRALATRLNVPTLLYQRTERPDAIVASLEEMLGDD
jgi:hypothetical protein